MKKFLKVLLFIVIILFISLGVYCCYDYFLGNDDDLQDEVKIIKKIDKYDYTLKENETELYKEEFKNLVKVLSEKEISYEDYAKSISKLFIIDFYTLNNKKSKNDVGGTEFIKPDIVDNFIENARSTMYKYIKSSDSNTSDFTEVSKIANIELIETTFTYKSDKSTVPAYKVNIIWEYKDDIGYETEANIILVREDDKLFIVEMD